LYEKEGEAEEEREKRRWWWCGRERRCRVKYVGGGTGYIEIMGRNSLAECRSGGFARQAGEAS